MQSLKAEDKGSCLTQGVEEVDKWSEKASWEGDLNGDLRDEQELISQKRGKEPSGQKD